VQIQKKSSLGREAEPEIKALAADADSQDLLWEIGKRSRT
jgi:hypothetical protein